MKNQNKWKECCLMGSLPNNIHYSWIVIKYPFELSKDGTPFVLTWNVIFIVLRTTCIHDINIIVFSISLLLFQIDFMGPHCLKLQRASPSLPSRPTPFHVLNLLTLVFLNGLNFRSWIYNLGRFGVIKPFPWPLSKHCMTCRMPLHYLC